MDRSNSGQVGVNTVTGGSPAGKQACPFSLAQNHTCVVCIQSELQPRLPPQGTSCSRQSMLRPVSIILPLTGLATLTSCLPRYQRHLNRSLDIPPVLAFVCPGTSPFLFTLAESNHASQAGLKPFRVVHVGLKLLSFFLFHPPQCWDDIIPGSVHHFKTITVLLR